MLTGGAGVVFWLVLAVVLFIVESATAQMICIWFSIGSVMAAILSGFGAPLWLQLLVFLLASVAVLVFGRPLLLDWVATRKVPTNADQIIGQTGIVTEEVNNLQETGRVSAGGLLWTARSADSGFVIPKDYPVRAVRIDGVKLIVEPLELTIKE